jgi:hypothetical protein
MLEGDKIRNVVIKKETKKRALILEELDSNEEINHR